MTIEPVQTKFKTGNQVTWNGNNGLKKTGTIQSKVSKSGKLQYEVGTTNGSITINAEKINK